MDGVVCYGSANMVVGLNLRTGKANFLAEAPANVSCVTADPEGRIYFACGPDVYALKEQSND